MNDTPSRPEFFIKDGDLRELVRKIFYTVDQGWTDWPAFEVSKLIEEYISRKYEV